MLKGLGFRVKGHRTHPVLVLACRLIRGRANRGNVLDVQHRLDTDAFSDEQLLKGRAD
jgi:hypothetical protein